MDPWKGIPYQLTNHDFIVVDFYESFDTWKGSDRIWQEEDSIWSQGSNHLHYLHLGSFLETNGPWGPEREMDRNEGSPWVYSTRKIKSSKSANFSKMPSSFLLSFSCWIILPSLLDKSWLYIFLAFLGEIQFDFFISVDQVFFASISESAVDHWRSCNQRQRGNQVYTFFDFCIGVCKAEVSPPFFECHILSIYN